MNFSVGTELTYLTYSEISNGATTSLTNMSLTGKISFVYQAASSPILFGLSAYKTLITLSQLPDTLARPDYLGLNARAGIAITYGVFFFFGYYYSKMTVPGDAYGIDTAYGPQIALAFTVPYTKSNNRTLSLTAKYVPMLITGEPLSFRNLEIGIGFAIQLIRLARSRFHIDMIADVSILTVTALSGFAVTTNTYSGGLQVGY